MTRKVNTTFQGADDKEAEVDAPVYRKTFENVAGDTAHVNDILFGDNTPPASSTCDHSGKDAGSGRYRGCPLGIPLGQTIMPTSPSHRFHLRNSGATSNVWAFLIPLYLPRGETTVRCRLHDANPNYGHTLFAMNTSYAEVKQRQMEPPMQDPNSRELSATLLDLTARSTLLVGVKTNLSPSAEARVFRGARLYWNRVAPPGWQPMVPAPQGSNPYSLLTQASGGATFPNPPTIDSALFTVPYPVSGWLVDRLAKWQNTLDEWMSGAPANGNNAMTLVPDGGTPPTRSAIHDHSQSTEKPNEPLIDVPIWAASFGAITDAGINLTVSATDRTWVAPGLKTIASWKTFLENVCLYMPRMPNGAATSKLKMLILGVDSQDAWGTGAGTTDVSARVSFCDSTAVFKPTATATFSRLSASTPASRFALCTITGIEFYAGQWNRMKLEFNATTLKIADGTSFQPIGASLYMEA